MTTYTRCALTLSAAVLMLPQAALAQRADQQSKPRAAGGARETAPVRVATSEHAQPQGFSVVLVAGDMQAGSDQDTVPPAARRALADMKDFLPYKSYRLLDTQWSLCCGRAPLISRLRGADGQEYELELSASVTGVPAGRAPAVNVRFQLTEASAAMATAEGARAESGDTSRVSSAMRQEIQRVQTQLAAARKAVEQRYEVGMGVAPGRDPRVLELEDLLGELTIKLAQVRERGPVASTRKFASRPIIDTSFRMDVGETVVVGTSRVKGGDKALIALLTAVPQRGNR